MGCIDKVLFIGLTCAISYQVWYNLTGAMELGGKYMGTKELLYSIGTLLPAIYLGIHACKLVFAKSDEARQTLASSKLSKYICYFYTFIFGAMVVFRLFTHFQHK